MPQNPSVIPPPASERAAIVLAGTARFARASSWVLVVLAGLSTLGGLLRPLSASFLISILALGNGVIEWRQARRLPGHDHRPLLILARNQLALGLEILGYTLWRLSTFSSAEILAVLERPELRTLLDALPPEEVERLARQLPPMYFAVIAISGVATALGCWGVAWYYSSRRKFLPPAAA